MILMPSRFPHQATSTPLSRTTAGSCLGSARFVHVDEQGGPVAAEKLEGFGQQRDAFTP